MPNTIGTLGGKHITIKAAANMGSAFLNYKDQHSVVFLRMVDANYSFTYINVGINGRISDGGVFRERIFLKRLKGNWLKVPEDKPLSRRIERVSDVIVADAAFTLSTHILKPYPLKGFNKEKRVFNYRLTQARRVVENAFGILANRFRILLNTIPLNPEKAKLIVQASCTLYNYLLKENQTEYLGNNPEEIDRRYTLICLWFKQTVWAKAKNEAIKVRQEFTDYVNGYGRAPWQDSVH